MTGNYDLSRDGGVAGGSVNIAWEVTDGLNAAYACPTISADTFTPTRDIRAALSEHFNRRINTLSPGNFFG